MALKQLVHRAQDFMAGKNSAHPLARFRRILLLNIIVGAVLRSSQPRPHALVRKILGTFAVQLPSQKGR